MKETIITFETAKLAKEKGFDIDNGKCFDKKQNYYSWDIVTWFNESENKHLQFDETITPIYYRPTQSLLQKWLREVHDIDVIINTYRNQDNKWYKFFISEKSKDILKSDDYKSYEEALKIGLQEALKLIETVKNEKV